MIEVHILIACSDARDYNRNQTLVLNSMSEEYRKKGIEIRLHILRVAGAFVTPDVVMDIKRIIEDVQRYSDSDDIKYFVHIQAHGHLDDKSNTNYISHIYEMNIVPGSPLNCGMLDATTVGIELEQLLINSKMLVRTPKTQFNIENEGGIIRLLRDVYSFDGHLAGDWIKGIDKLRTHPRLQKTILEQAIRHDAALRSLDIKITAGIQDYRIHSLIRLDGGEPPVPFWDETMQKLRALAKVDQNSWEAQLEKQKPFAGLFSMTHPDPGLRALATMYFAKQKNYPVNDESLTNTVFQITGSSFDLPTSPFGPYVIGGFFYAVKHLSLHDWMVIGDTSEQTSRMLRKLENDPIIHHIKDCFNIEWIPLNTSEILQ
jgi:hypothetical protein